MTNNNLKTNVHAAFQFLLDEYGYSINRELYEQEMGNAIVMFSRGNARIEVVKDRGQILVRFGNERLDQREWIEFAQAVQHFSKNLDPVYAFPPEYNEATESAQIYHVASLMKMHCHPIVSGEISAVQLHDTLLVERRAATHRFLENLGGVANRSK
jgi:hypothetical protein